MNKTSWLPARVFGVATLVFSGWLPASPLLAAPAVQVGFSPEGSAQQLVLSVIGEARRDIRLMGYAFTSPEVARALIAAHRRGVVVDAKANQNGAGRAALNLLANAGVNVRTVNSYNLVLVCGGNASACAGFTANKQRLA